MEVAQSLFSTGSSSPSATYCWIAFSTWSRNANGTGLLLQNIEVVPGFSSISASIPFKSPNSSLVTSGYLLNRTACYTECTLGSLLLQVRINLVQSRRNWYNLSRPKSGSCVSAFSTVIKEPLITCWSRETVTIISPTVGSTVPSYCRWVTEEGCIVLFSNLARYTAIDNSAPVSTSNFTQTPLITSCSEYLVQLYEVQAPALKSHLHRHCCLHHLRLPVVDEFLLTWMLCRTCELVHSLTCRLWQDGQSCYIYCIAYPCEGKSLQHVWDSHICSSCSEWVATLNESPSLVWKFCNSVDAASMALLLSNAVSMVRSRIDNNSRGSLSPQTN